MTDPEKLHLKCPKDDLTGPCPSGNGRRILFIVSETGFPWEGAGQVESLQGASLQGAEPGPVSHGVSPSSHRCAGRSCNNVPTPTPAPDPRDKRIRDPH